MKISTFFGIHWLRALFERNFNRWLAKRIPSQSEHSLNSNNILIYPTRFGLGYVAIVTLIFLLGTNYQNNIILLLSYLLASFFISVMLHSFYNFSTLRFNSVNKQHGYVSEVISFPINITTKKQHYDINVLFADKQLINKSLTNKVSLAIAKKGTHTVLLPFQATKRGLQKIGRVIVYSEYSLGLFKSKTILDFAHHAIVFPKPKSLVAGQYQLSGQADEPVIESYHESTHSGTDDFSELKSFVTGESRARTAWKQLAKGQGHFSKHYQGSQGQLQWLKLSDMPGNDIETRLRYLSFLIHELTAVNQVFGLDLHENSITGNSSKNIAPNTGFDHQQACLIALALYP